MKKKGKQVLVILFVSLILISSVSMVSAAWYSPFTDWLKDLFSVGEDSGLSGELGNLPPGGSGDVYEGSGDYCEEDTYFEDCLKAYYKLDNKEEDFEQDFSGNEHHGQVHGDVYYEQNVGVFDGDEDYIEADYFSRSKNSVSSETLSAWVYPHGESSIFHGSEGVVSIMKKESCTNCFNYNPQAEISYNSETNEIQCYASYYRKGIIISSPMSIDKWTHTVCVYDYNPDNKNMEISLYVDGVLENTGSRVASRYYYDSDIIRIGLQKPVRLRYFAGSIDEVKVFGKALNGSEVSELYGEGRFPEINLTPQILVLRENYENELIEPNPPQHYSDWHLMVQNIQDRINETNKINESYDFLLMVPTVRNGFNSYPANRNISGIGNSVVSSYSHDPNLKRIITLSLNSSGFFSANRFADKYVKSLVIHEIGHHWLVEVKGFFENPQQSMGGHYKTNIDLAYGIGDLDPMGSSRWSSQNGTKQCVTWNDLNFEGEIKFSKLSLYLMGLIPPEELPPINVYDYEGEQYFAGPGCSRNPNWTTTRKISVNDIITSNGPRIPSSEDSQKNFKALFVVILRYNETLSEEYIEYVDLYRKALPKAWAEATSNLSTIELL